MIFFADDGKITPIREKSEGTIVKKTVWIALLLVLTLLSGCVTTTGSAKVKEGTEPVTATPFDALALLDVGKIRKISYALNTEGGVMAGDTTDEEIIQLIIEKLTGVEIEGETNRAVEDKGLSIVIETDATTLEFAFEDDVLVVGDMRFEVSNIEPLYQYIENLLGE